MTPYVAVTEDFGESWRLLSGGVGGGDEEEDPVEGLDGYVHVVRQDPVQPSLLFAGTELGLFLSLDAGEQWLRLPAVPQVGVRDLDIHPRDHDLILGTHGRGVLVVDDITPLRSLAGIDLDAELVVLPSRPSVQMATAAVQGFAGGDEFVGETLPEVASIYYFQKRRHIFGDMKLEIFDPEGNRVAEIPAGKRRGLNRVDWAMRRPR